jgi:DnaJ-class molecular chaperone
MEMTCDECGGTGYVVCPECDGSGKVDEEYEERVERYLRIVESARESGAGNDR